VGVETKSPLELFSDFYELQNHQPMTAEQRAFAEGLMQQIWEEQA
jgi:exonuclease SbcD